jgi:glycosyltransferase involved in cell wall biosynthesis
MHTDKTLVVIPAYNAESTIGELVEQIRDRAVSVDVLVVDDGSTDSTAQSATVAGVSVVRHPCNLGKGRAIRTGLRYAAERDYSGFVTIDSDLQHDPGSIADFLSTASGGQFDLILGVRRRTIDMPRHRALTNFATSALLSLLAGVCLRDTQTGYRWHKTTSMLRLRATTDRYDYESEVLLKAGRAGMKLGEVTVPTIYRGSRSFINPVLDAWRFLRLIVRSWFW